MIDRFKEMIDCQIKVKSVQLYQNILKNLNLLFHFSHSSRWYLIVVCLYMSEIHICNQYIWDFCFRILAKYIHRNMPVAKYPFFEICFFVSFLLVLSIVHQMYIWRPGYQNIEKKCVLVGKISGLNLDILKVVYVALF